jgi:hypothetical protein
MALGGKKTMILTLGRWTIECDPKATSACYSSLRVGSGCDCTDCRNFIDALDLAFPDKVREFLISLGIDTRKPAELCHYGREESGIHCTAGWFHVVGSIRSGADAWTPRGENGWVADLHRLEEGIELGFTDRLSLVPESFKQQRIVQLEFVTRVPWVIADTESP